ncbi:hypothetical protein MP228_012717 [Amoeboaphelidium protococcarum]|nr:hypothetical protein MP228_012717 [Amoeboaphelidium protococcarum]
MALQQQDKLQQPQQSLAAPPKSKPMIQPINRIFSYLTSRAPVSIWLMDQYNLTIEGIIIGFDEFMNLVLDDAVEVHEKLKTRNPLGRIMLKGDSIAMMRQLPTMQDGDE